MTKDIEKVENLYSNLPRSVKIIGKQITRSYTVRWERQGVEDYVGARFVFMIHEENQETN
jgi:hypothetical protein